MSAGSVSCERHRFRREIIGHGVWLYFRFPLSFRLIDEMLLERGIVVSYETIRRWSLKFGAAYARRLRRKPARRGDIWHLDEVRIVIGGRSYWLWRSVDQKMKRTIRTATGDVDRQGFLPTAQRAEIRH